MQAASSSRSRGSRGKGLLAPVQPRHDWFVGVLDPLFFTAGHTVRTQQGGVTASAGQLRGDVELRNYLGDQAGSRSLSWTSASRMTVMGVAAPHAKWPLDTRKT